MGLAVTWLVFRPIATFLDAERLAFFFLTGVTACKVLVAKAEASRSTLNRIIVSRECFRGKGAPLRFQDFLLKRTLTLCRILPSQVKRHSTLHLSAEPRHS